MAGVHKVPREGNHPVRREVYPALVYVYVRGFNSGTILFEKFKIIERIIGRLNKYLCSYI
jgi:hypothetical protein